MSQEGQVEPSGPRPIADDPATQETAARQAAGLGQQHSDAGIAPFGDAHQMYWDEGSARLLSALAVSSQRQKTMHHGASTWSTPTVMPLETPEARHIEVDS